MANDREMTLVRLLSDSMKREAPNDRIEVSRVPVHCDGPECHHEDFNPPDETQDCGCSCRACVAVITAARIKRDSRDAEAFEEERRVERFSLRARVEELSTTLEAREKCIDMLTAERDDLVRKANEAGAMRVDTAKRYERKIELVIAERDAAVSEFREERAKQATLRANIDVFTKELTRVQAERDEMRGNWETAKKATYQGMILLPWQLAKGEFEIAQEDLGTSYDDPPVPKFVEPSVEVKLTQAMEKIDEMARSIGVRDVTDANNYRRALEAEMRVESTQRQVEILRKRLDDALEALEGKTVEVATEKAIAEQWFKKLEVAEEKIRTLREKDGRSPWMPEPEKPGGDDGMGF